MNIPNQTQNSFKSLTMGRGGYDHTGIAPNAPGYIATHPPRYAMTTAAAPVQYTPVNVAAPVSYGPVYAPMQPMMAQQAMMQQYQTAAAPMAPTTGYQMYQQTQVPLIQQPQIQQQPLQQQQQIQQANANPYFYTSMTPGTINPQLLCTGGSFNGQAMYQIAPSGGIQGGVIGPQGK
ncbi:hypothetical protein VHEMI07554 [[Torrubiella] hemipterigena]|uniref:Uncharacterized protein n=1 Tax=[Torrubiella] hemipterigena TaxID=1531966 RepID=A0A0A1T3V8_9HYPO|nr:hypothetical protein VHEMI07554 [[Torrubiella] hemipterigena]